MASNGLFRKAQRSRRRLRLAFDGTSGSGKTFTGLSVASGIADYIGETTGRRGRVCVIDTEHGSSELYASLFDFDVLILEHFDPRNYITAIQAAEAERYDVIMIDSLSHAWTGKGGALQMVDNAAERNKGNSFVAWRSVTPVHNALVDAMIRSPSHVIVTMRTKTEYVVEKGVPRKVGMAPIQREGTEYEFDIVIDMNQEHGGVVSKTRLVDIDGQVIDRPGMPLGRKLAAWLNEAPSTAVLPAAPPQVATPEAESPQPLPVRMADVQQLNEFTRLTAALGIDVAGRISILARRGVTQPGNLTSSQMAEILFKLREKWEAANPTKAELDREVDGLMDRIQTNPAPASAGTIPDEPEPEPETAIVQKPPPPLLGGPPADDDTDVEDDLSVPDIDSRELSERARKRAAREANGVKTAEAAVVTA